MEILPTPNKLLPIFDQREVIMTESILQLTLLAASHIDKMIATRGVTSVFRLAVKKTGCSGYMYQPEILEEPKAGDCEIETGYDFKVFVDPASIELLRGTTIDFISKGLGQQQLIFRNPNAKSECGCGESFYIEE